VVLLDPKVELGWPGFALVMTVATNTKRDTQGLYQEFYLQFTISVKIFQKGMNLGRFQFEVDPTQTPMRLHLEHRIHISGWLRAAWRKAEDGTVAADGDNGAAWRPGRRGAGHRIAVPGDGPGNGLHVGKAKWATGEKEGEWAGRRELAQKV
jgi:hypothetical protein